MNPTIKSENIMAIIKCGIIGSLAITGLALITIIIGNVFSSSLPFAAYLLAQFMSKCTLEGLFITTASVGFVFGMVVRRRLPFLQKGITPLAIVAIPLIIGAWMLNAFAVRVERPYKIKLADCAKSITKVHFHAPAGRNYYLAFEPNEGNNTQLFKSPGSGRIQIAQDLNIITNLPVSGQIDCSFIRANTSYNLEITFDQTPPPSNSIWLHWGQSFKDN